MKRGECFFWSVLSARCPVWPSRPFSVLWEQPLIVKKIISNHTDGKVMRRKKKEKKKDAFWNPFDLKWYKGGDEYNKQLLSFARKVYRAFPFSMILMKTTWIVSRGYASTQGRYERVGVVKNLAEFVQIMLPPYVLLMETTACFCHCNYQHFSDAHIRFPLSLSLSLSQKIREAKDMFYPFLIMTHIQPTVARARMKYLTGESRRSFNPWLNELHRHAAVLLPTPPGSREAARLETIFTKRSGLQFWEKVPLFFFLLAESLQ